MNIEIQEVAPKGSRRTELGRIVVSPPNGKIVKLFILEWQETVLIIILYFYGKW